MYWILGVYLFVGLWVAFRVFSVTDVSRYGKLTLIQGFVQLSIAWIVYVPVALYQVLRERKVHGRSASENIQM